MNQTTRKYSDNIQTFASENISEEYFKRAFSQASIGLAFVNLDGSFAYTNQAYLAITGYSADELRDLKIGALMHPDDAATNSKLRAKMLAGEIPGYILEKRYIRRDGSHIWVKSSVSLSLDDNGDPHHIVGLIEDIDKHHKAEVALKESETRFRFMAEFMPSKVFTARPDGFIDYLSPQWTDYTGLVVKAMDLQTWTQVVHPDDVQENAKQWKRAIESGKPFYFEHRLRRSDGSYRWHLCRAHAMRDSAGQVIQWLGSDTDIEAAHQSKALKTRLKALAKQREELIAMNRAKDEFIMLASHQLRTPATGVKQFVGMLLEGYGGNVPANQRTMLEQAYDCNERQIQIVNDLLRVAQVDAGKVSVRKAPCDVAQLVQGITAELRDTFSSRKQAVTISGSHKKISAIIDAKLMRMVLENLLDNASKYSPAGKPIRLNVQRNRKLLVIKIEDNGVGIRKKDQSRLFQKFSRIDNPLSDIVGGTGLGLYWVKKIVELHGGTLEVVSKLRHGSTFTVTLPG